MKIFFVSSFLLVLFVFSRVSGQDYKNEDASEDLVEKGFWEDKEYDGYFDVDKLVNDFKMNIELADAVAENDNIEIKDGMENKEINDDNPHINNKIDQVIEKEPMQDYQYEDIKDKSSKRSNDEEEYNDYIDFESMEDGDEEDINNKSDDYSVMWGKIMNPEKEHNDLEVVEDMDDAVADDNVENTPPSKEVEARDEDSKPIMSYFAPIAQETKMLLDGSDDFFEANSEIKRPVKKSDDDSFEAIPGNKNQVNSSDDESVQKTLESLNEDLNALYTTIEKLSENKEDVSKNDYFDGDNGVDKVEDDDYDSVGLSEEDTKEDATLIETVQAEENIFGDNIVDDLQNTNSQLEQFLDEYNKGKIDDMFDSSENIDTDQNNTSNEDIKQVFASDLGSAEIDDLTKQFALAHKDEIDVNGKNFARNIAAVHIKLNFDDATEITSPEYPNPYPTNNIVDWIIEGDGIGIEVNITDFAVNGALGDYLLIKPGGIDASGDAGLLFTYRLNSVRKYRFTDVDKMFIRFQSNLGMMFYNGFKLSMKMIAPRVTTDNSVTVPIEEPAPLQPNSTATFTFAVDLFSFNNTSQAFMKLLDEMVLMFREENEGFENIIDHVIIIKSASTCPINWPNFVQCSSVTVAVALEKDSGTTFMDEQDIFDAWYNYKGMEQFAEQIELLGLSDFTPPESPMTAWLLIASGIVTSMAILGFILWRYSCFQTYTRMQSYNDMENYVDEKRGLDLYPTPHQTLPPLFNENEYKWANENTDYYRVDGGLTNKSYVRETMYDFESDEELPKMEKYTTDV